MSLLDIAGYISTPRALLPIAKKLGFDSDGDIERFIRQAYGKALRQMPDADRPRGTMFFLAPPSAKSAVATPASLIPIIKQIQVSISTEIYTVTADAATAPQSSSLNAAARKQMEAGMWSSGTAQRLSRDTQTCVIWTDAVEVKAYLDGDTLLETVDVTEELAGPMSRNANRLGWNEGEVAFNFAAEELNDTSPSGVWFIPGKYVLRPKPEVMMSARFGRFLQLRMAGYLNHEPESTVAHLGRSDIVLTTVWNHVYIVEVKWTGRSLSSTRASESEQRILAELKKRKSTWFTVFADDTFTDGAKQVAIYFGSGKYKKGYVIVFDCCAPATGRGHTVIPPLPADVHPHGVQNFRILRACVDPRKASTISKAKSP